jgi:hypothetical protein
MPNVGRASTLTAQLQWGSGVAQRILSGFRWPSCWTFTTTVSRSRTIAAIASRQSNRRTGEHGGLRDRTTTNSPSVDCTETSIALSLASLNSDLIIPIKLDHAANCEPRSFVPLSCPIPIRSKPPSVQDRRGETQCACGHTRYHFARIRGVIRPINSYFRGYETGRRSSSGVQLPK